MKGTVTIRMWTENGYHKDVATLDARQVWSSYQVMECGVRHLVPPINAVRLVVDPKAFPEAIEFEVIVERE